MGFIRGTTVVILLAVIANNTDQNVATAMESMLFLHCVTLDMLGRKTRRFRVGKQEKAWKRALHH